MPERSLYDAARRAAACLDRSSRGLLAVTGRDRASYLQGVLTNDVMLPPGRGCYAAYLTPQGRMVADMIVLALEDRILLDVQASVAEAVRARMDRFVFSEDVQIEDLRESHASVGVYGPDAARVLARVAPEEGGLEERVRRLGEHDHLSGVVHGAPAAVARTDDLGGPGFHVYLERARATGFLEALRAAGVPALDHATREVLRIEAGRPEFTSDMDTNTIPLEAGIESRAVSMTKGCYVGQEVIIRVLHRGHGRVARKLCGLEVSAGDGAPAPIPARGAAVRAGEREVGTVTSAAFSPAVGAPIALAWLRRDFADPGTPLAVDAAGRLWNATVKTMPFVAPEA